jgi:hypothetical protein
MASIAALESTPVSSVTGRVIAGCAIAIDADNHAMETERAEERRAENAHHLTTRENEGISDASGARHGTPTSPHVSAWGSVDADALYAAAASS